MCGFIFSFRNIRLSNQSESNAFFFVYPDASYYNTLHTIFAFIIFIKIFHISFFIHDGKITDFHIIKMVMANYSMTLLIRPLSSCRLILPEMQLTYYFSVSLER